MARVLSCKFCEISKKTFFHRTSLVAASGIPLANCVVWPIAGLNGIGFNAMNIMSYSKIYHSKESQTKGLYFTTVMLSEAAVLRCS